MDKPLRDTTELDDGRIIEAVEIAGHGLRIKVLSLGAAIQDLRLDGYGHPLVLGYQEVSSYADNAAYIGAIVGRYANRIAKGQVTLDGTAYQLDLNNNGNSLHGGADGTSAQNWTFKEVGADFATLTLNLPDGHMGFPGELSITCTYQILPDATLDIKLNATTDTLTLCNLAPHVYFNLDGTESVADHQLKIEADHFTPTDTFGIPTGEIKDVSQSNLDFRAARPANDAEIDFNFCTRETTSELQANATLTGPDGLSLTVYSNQPGLQVFNGPGLDVAHLGLHGQHMGAYAGVAFEPQNWPDSPNHENFPSSVLKPGETYLNHSRFVFK